MFEKIKNAVPGGLHLHTAWEVLSGFFSLRDSELKASDFGKGWGDEHQWLEILRQLPSHEDREIWEGFIAWHYLGRKRLEGVSATRALRQLREFITSWDKERTELGTVTTKTKKTLKTMTIDTEQVEKVFGPKTTNGIEFIKECVVKIRRGEEEARAKLMTDRRLPWPASQADKDQIADGCRQYGYVALVRQFRLAQIPTLPIGDEMSFTRHLDQFFEKLLGKNFNFTDATRALEKAMEPLLKRRERRKERLQYVYERPWLWWAVPAVHLYNIING